MAKIYYEHVPSKNSGATWQTINRLARSLYRSSRDPCIKWNRITPVHGVSCQGTERKGIPLSRLGEGVPLSEDLTRAHTPPPPGQDRTGVQLPWKDLGPEIRVTLAPERPGTKDQGPVFRDTPPPHTHTCWQTHTCENSTFPILWMRALINGLFPDHLTFRNMYLAHHFQKQYDITSWETLLHWNIWSDRIQNDVVYGVKYDFWLFHINLGPVTFELKKWQKIKMVQLM